MAKAAAKRTDRKKPRSPNEDPRQQRLVDPQTGEEIDAPFKIERLDKAYLAECRMRTTIAQQEAKLEKLVEQTNEILDEEMANIKEELGDGVPYTTVNDKGQLRDIARFTPEPRRYDKKSRLRHKTDD